MEEASLARSALLARALKPARNKTIRQAKEIALLDRKRFARKEGPQGKPAHGERRCLRYTADTHHGKLKTSRSPGW